MTELLPCPFCGGEARIIAKPYEPKVCVGCDDDTCLGFSGLGWLYDSEKEATEAWNQRAERACRMEKDDRYSEMYEGPMLRCTRCDALFQRFLQVSITTARTAGRELRCSDC